MTCEVTRKQIMSLLKCYGTPRVQNTHEVSPRGEVSIVTCSVDVHNVGISILAQGRSLHGQVEALRLCYEQLQRINARNQLQLIRTTVYVPCGTCGNLTSMLGTMRCNNCWEVEHRLESYLQSNKGKLFVLGESKKALERLCP